MKLKIIPTPEFSKQTKKLAKTYKNIVDDLDFLKNELLKNPKGGTELGNNCYKIRIPNSSIPTGKSGGFRIITYYVVDNNLIRLLLIYSKKEKQSISNKEIQEVLQKNNL